MPPRFIWNTLIDFLSEKYHCESQNGNWTPKLCGRPLQKLNVNLPFICFGYLRGVCAKWETMQQVTRVVCVSVFARARARASVGAPGSPHTPRFPLPRVKQWLWCPCQRLLHRLISKRQANVLPHCGFLIVSLNLLQAWICSRRLPWAQQSNLFKPPRARAGAAVPGRRCTRDASPSQTQNSPSWQRHTRVSVLRTPTVPLETPQTFSASVPPTALLQRRGPFLFPFHPLPPFGGGIQDTCSVPGKGAQWGRCPQKAKQNKQTSPAEIRWAPQRLLTRTTPKPARHNKTTSSFGALRGAPSALEPSEPGGVPRTWAAHPGRVRVSSRLAMAGRGGGREKDLPYLWRRGDCRPPAEAAPTPDTASSSQGTGTCFMIRGRFSPTTAESFLNPVGPLGVALPQTAFPCWAVATARGEERGQEQKAAATRRLRLLLLLLLLLSHSQSLLPGPEQLSGFHRGTAATSLGGETWIFMRKRGGRRIHAGKRLGVLLHSEPRGKPPREGVDGDARYQTFLPAFASGAIGLGEYFKLLFQALREKDVFTSTPREHRSRTRACRLIRTWTCSDNNDLHDFLHSS